jgi:hypothetical protein
MESGQLTAANAVRVHKVVRGCSIEVSLRG